MSKNIFSALFHRLSRIDAAIQEERSHRYPDMMRIITLKKLRLQLKDTMTDMLLKSIEAKKVRKTNRAARKAGKALTKAKRTSAKGWKPRHIRV